MVLKHVIDWIDAKESEITIGETKHGLIKVLGLNGLRLAIDSAVCFGAITVTAACLASAMVPFAKK